ncbi:MAG: hypothetical protein ABJH08_09670 [Balneola sp.]
MVFLIILIYNSNLKSQSHHISISTELNHISATSTNWFNASGFKAGYFYAFQNNNLLSIEFGHTLFFEGNKSSVDLLTSALFRSSKNYRILKTSFHANLIRLKKSTILFHIGPSIRFVNEVDHSFAVTQGNESNTSEILTTTNYNKETNIGSNFGLSFLKEISTKIDGNLFIEIDNYGAASNSILSMGLKGILKL